MVENWISKLRYCTPVLMLKQAALISRLEEHWKGLPRSLAHPRWRESDHSTMEIESTEGREAGTHWRDFVLPNAIHILGRTYSQS